MTLSDFVEVLLAICSIAAVTVVGHSNIKKQVISDLQALVMAHEQTINKLKEENAEVKAAWAKDSKAKDERIRVLEETVDGYSELVRKGHLLGSSGTRSRNRSTTTETT